jgi:phenylacetic acid degradation operon negative regulatory protein
MRHKICRAFLVVCGHHPTVKAQAEEFMYFLLWTADTVLNPTWRNLTDSFEMWACRKGLMRQLLELDRRKFLERSPSVSVDRIVKLTDSGRLHALGGRDPRAQWARPWDRRWRLVIFDVPTRQNSARCRLRRYLRHRHFGYLQNSVWISPDPLTEERDLLARSKTDVESLIFMEAHPCAGESDAQIVAGAWDFTRINQEYARYREVLKLRPTSEHHGELAARALQVWIRNERIAWLNAVDLDPLLPEALWPKGYAGRQAWDARLKTLPQVRRQLERLKI